VRRRLDAAAAWAALASSGWRPTFAADDPVRPWAERAWPLLGRRIGEVPRLLGPWGERPLPVHPCLCDVWHDHVLYEGQRVSGLIDYGAVKVDHVAVDLARLLGSLVPDEPRRWAEALEAYSSVRRLTPEEEALARVLDRTGAAIAAASWLRRLSHEGEAVEDRAVVARRLATLVRRMEGWE
jgi:homoserine kinase type II